MRKLAIGLIILTACGGGSDGGTPVPQPAQRRPIPPPASSTGPSPSTITLLGLEECQLAAQEGLNTLHAAFQLVQEEIPLDEYDHQFRDVYLSADTACLDFLADESTFDPRLEACEMAGHYAGEAGYLLVRFTIAETMKETKRESREALAAISQAGANWRTCFPGEALPEDLRIN